MNRSLRAAAGLAAAALMAACAAAGAAEGAPRLPKLSLPTFGAEQHERIKLKPGQWPQAVSDLAADPDIRFGALPNGMRYAIRRQTTPPGQAAIRLRIDAGSLMETDDQQGLAHFLEHMAFNGSKAVPEGDMVKILERLGLAFGADTNASTDFDETVYKLDLPRTDDETVDTSLMLMREVAGNLTIAPDAVDRERGVVLSEERARDTPSYRVYKARQAFFLKGQRPPTRLPIGQVDVLEHAPASRIASFYHAYYRPDRAVLVAVGDFDVDAMEAKIRARFGDWTGVGPAGGDPDMGPVAKRDTEAMLDVEPGAPPSLQLAWMGPPDLNPDTKAERRRDLIEKLGFAVLNRRFSALSRSADPPFIGAAAFKGDEYDAARVTMITANVQQDHWREALAAVDREERRAVQYGVRQDELDREIEEVRASLKADAAGAATRPPAAIAADIVGSLDDDEVVTDPAQDLAFFEDTVKGLKADEVSAALKAAFQGGGPLLFVTSPTAIEGGEATLLSALADSQKVAVTPPTAPSVVTWPYESFGAPGKVAERKDVVDLDTVFVRFENGVRLTIKPTKFADDQILVRVNVGDGLQDLPKDKQNAAWAAGAYVEGGLGKISAEDMERVLASKYYGASFSVTDDAFVLSGGTRPESLDTQLEVLAAYLTDPGWRPQAFERIKTAGATINEQYTATDGGVLKRDLPGLMHTGDRRWTFPSKSEIEHSSLDELKRQVAGPMASGPVEVVIVGDTTVDKAIEAAARTFGALPPRPAAAPPSPSQLQVAFPAPVSSPVELTHKGRKDQAIGYIAWPTKDFFADPQGARDTAVMAEVMRLRLIDELREAQGATYSPSVTYNHSLVWPGWGYVAASVEVPPAKLASFFTDARQIAAELAAKDASPDELERAKKPRIDQIEKARETNGYWLHELSGAQADPRRLDEIRAAVAGTERVSADDVRRAAQTYLRDDKAWTLEVRPQP
ncbi:M16 family metallopeptidase [Phenylobacterium sp.]|uniref:M16 family metallopeptidase n=1 Tax=Phenylobacterium sp. TaxID=1871053 RepID=UPI0035B28ADB